MDEKVGILWCSVVAQKCFLICVFSLYYGTSFDLPGLTFWNVKGSGETLGFGLWQRITAAHAFCVLRTV